MRVSFLYVIVNHKHDSLIKSGMSVSRRLIIVLTGQPGEIEDNKSVPKFH